VAKRRPFYKRLRDWLVYLSARAFLFIGAWLPQPVGYAIAEALGSAAWFLARREREKTLRNVYRGLGGELSREELRAIARGMFIHYAKVAYEVTRFRRMTPEWIRSHLEFEGLELVTEAVKAGRGVIVATGHIGNWELMGAAVSALGVPTNVIARRINHPRINDLVVRLRETSGVRTILREARDSAKLMLRALRRGELLALLIDQDVRVEGAYVDFFGMPAHTPTGAAALAKRTGSLFVAASIQRIAPGRHLVRAVPIEIADDEDPERAIIEATAEATAQFERWIRERPQQWCWNHDRWRRTRESQAAEKGAGTL